MNKTLDQKSNKLVDELVNSALAETKEITGPKGPDQQLQASYQDMLKRTGDVRGRPLFYPYLGSGRGRGPYIRLSDGSVKLDLINGIGIHILGHSHPEITKASVRGALSDSVMQGNLQPNQEYLDLSEKLLSIASRKSRLSHVWFATCGTMANENALKMCRQKMKGARKVIAMQNAFAGRSTMMAEITDNPAFKQGLPEYNEILRVPFASAYSLSACGESCKNGCKSEKESKQALELMQRYVSEHPNDIGAFTFEPMQGEGGFKIACKKYLTPLLEFCKSKGIPVWADEVQTFCRTGNFFAYETIGFGEYVDVCTVAKTLQTGATLYTKEMNPQPGLIAGTFSGSSASLAAGLEVLRILDEEGYMGPSGKIQKIHTQFVEGLTQLSQTTCKGLLSEIGGLGLMIAATPLDGSKEKVNEFLQVLFKNGLIAFSAGKSPLRIRFLLPAVLEANDIKEAMKIIEKSLHEIANKK